MADLENALSGILSDPDAMMKIKALGEQLGLSGESPPAPAPLNTKSGSKNGANPMELLSQADPTLLSGLSKFLPILSNMKKEDETTALLCALRPFLSNERQARLEEAQKILRIMKVLPFIRKSGLF